MELTIEALSQILEEELENAFEAKDKKSLHRYVLLLSQNMIHRDRHDREYHRLRSDIKEIALRIERMQERMDARFEAIDKRFEIVDKRFEDNQKTLDKRFEENQKFINVRFDSIDQRFKMMLTFLSIGFATLALLMSLYNFF